MAPPSGKDLTLRRGALIAGNLLAVGMLISWFLQPSAVDRILQTAPKRVALPSITKPPPRTPSQLEMIQSRALFHSTRKFFVPPPAPTTPVDLKPPPPQYRVATVMMSAHQPPVALLTDAQGKGVLKVRTGDVLAGWTVESVAPKRVTLVFQQDHIELGPKLLASTPSSGDAGSTATPGTVGNPSTSSGTSFPHTSLLSAGPSSGGLRVLGGNSVTSSAGRPSVAPRVFTPPPH